MKMEIESAPCDQSKELSGKKRKKLYIKIRQQIEFYFSDSNLAKDKFLYDLIQKNSDGYVDLEIFKSCNKIKTLTEDVNFITSALSKSNILQVSEDKTQVRRITPIEISKDFDSCTLYVEGLPLYADHKWVKDVFDQFGIIDYICIPRYNISNKIKGFAFIEFNNPESIKKACQFYKNSSSDILCEEKRVVSKEDKVRKADDTSDQIAKKIKVSAELKEESNQSSNVHSGLNEELELSNTKVKKKRKHQKSDSEDEEPCKKAKTVIKENITENNVHTENIEEPNTCDTVKIDSIHERKEFSQNNTSESKGENLAKEKKKRKRSKKNQNRHERPTLRVMSKAEWKTYRNKYLDLQRATMSYLKKQLLLEAQEMKEQDIHTKLEQIPKKELAFQKGVILEIKLSKPVENPADFKELVKANAVVAYIDAPLGCEKAFVRCHTTEDADLILQDKKLNQLGTTVLLTGLDEEEYWKKIQKDREEKFNTPVIRKRRGRDKLIAKATKLIEQKNKHIYFDE